MDLVISAPHMPIKGETITGSSFMTNAGGKGANQAIAIKRSNTDVVLVGAIGNTFTEELKNNFKQEKVNTTYLKEVSNVSSGVAMIIISEGDNRIILDPGANYEVTIEDVDQALKSSKPGDYLVLQLEIKLDVVSYALEKAKSLGLITVLNPSPAAKLEDSLFLYVDYFIPNQSEAEIYTGMYPSNVKDANKVSKLLRAKGVKNVLITLGEEGAYLLKDDGTEYHVKGNKVKVVDTTAAGDTFIGNFVGAISKGVDLPQAMKIANSAAAIAITRRGAQQSIPYYKEVEEYLKHEQKISNN